LLMWSALPLPDALPLHVQRPRHRPLLVRPVFALPHGVLACGLTGPGSPGTQDDQRLHQGAGPEPGGEGNWRQRGRYGAGMDAAEPRGLGQPPEKMAQFGSRTPTLTPAAPPARSLPRWAAGRPRDDILGEGKAKGRRQRLVRIP